MGTPVVNSEAAIANPTPSEKREAYLKSLMATAQAAVPPAIAFSELRQQAAALLKEQTFPSVREEDWRFTDLSAMLDLPFRAVETAVDLDAAALSPVLAAEATGARLVFVNGRFSPALSDTTALPDGVVAGSLAALVQSDRLPAALSSRLAQASGQHEVFTALNTVGFQDAAVVWVPRNQEVTPPIQIINVTLPRLTPVMAQPRCLVVAESGSVLTLLENFWGTEAKAHFTNAVTEIWVDDNAEVQHLRVQQEPEASFHIAKTAVTQGRDSRYRCTAISLGATLARHHLEVYQAGEQTNTRLYGLAAIAQHQVSDTHSRVALSQPYGTVDQLHKCIVDDRSHSVFNGIIDVPQAAQMTNASQLNRNLMLSDKARVDTKPQLEIVADNVKCAHGATVSQLESDEVFYLQSRGIDAAQAQRLLIYAFAMEIIDQISLPSLKATLTDIVTARAQR